MNKKTEIHEDESILAKQQAFLGKFQIINLREKRTVCERKFVGLDCIDKLLTDLQETWENTIKMKKKYKTDWTPEKKNLHEQARQCKSCNVKFDNSDAKKVKHTHHLHYKEKDNYESALCADCNRAFQERTSTLNIIVHNLSYDLNLILKQASPHFEFNLNKRQGFKYYCAQVGKLKFIDSMNMIKGSLSSLANEFSEPFNMFIE